MVLNALNYDPKKTWKGVWRWVSEETLQCETREICGHSLEKVRDHGMTFTDFAALANCHGVNVESFPVDTEAHNPNCREAQYQAFRDRVISACSSDKAQSFIISHFSRKRLGQTGDGHFSPIGGSLYFLVHKFAIL